MQRACDFLSRREHSRKELQHKLKRDCDDVELIEELVTMLAAEGLQSDERFTRSFIKQCVGKGQGPIRIEQELEQRGIDKELIQHTLATQTRDWLQMAKKARGKKFGAQLPNSVQDKAKQFRFLCSRGFSAEQINQVLNLSIESE